jgi:hypothetical protein
MFKNYFYNNIINILYKLYKKITFEKIIFEKIVFDIITTNLLKQR